MIGKSHPRGWNHGLGKPRIFLSYMDTHDGLLFSRSFTQDRLSAHIRKQDRLSAHIRNFFLSTLHI